MRPIRMAMLSAVPFVLIGCGGGGGGDALRDFQSFTALQPGATTTVRGMGLATEYDANLGTGEVSAAAPDEFIPTVELTLDDGGALTAASLTIPASPGWSTPTTFEFDTADGDMVYDGDTADPIVSDYQVAVSAAVDQVAVVADPVAAGFEYQTFGIWATGIDTGSGVVGAASVGAPTPAAGIPDADSAHYTGMSAGFYIDPDDQAFLAFADFDAIVDFDDPSIDVFTTDTSVMSVMDGTVTAMPALDFDGFNGTVGADGSLSVMIEATDLAGNLNGQLYGPNAEELGGVFALEGDGGRYFGSFGAAQ